MSDRSGRAAGFGFVALAAALWGTDALFRVGLAVNLPASVIVFAEHVLLVILTFPLLLRALKVTRSFELRDWAAAVVVGAGASALATVLFTRAFVYGDPNTPLLLQKLQPLIAAFGAWVLLGERLLPRYLLYLVVALGGAYLITFADPTSVTARSLAAGELAVGAACLWGLGTVLGRHLTTKLTTAELTALRFGIGLVASAAIVLVDQGSSGYSMPLEARFIPGIIGLTLVPGLIAMLFYYRGLRTTPAAAATLGELTFPLTAIILNYLAFDEVMTATQWLGVLLLAGTITAMGLASRRSPRALGVDAPSAPAVALADSA